MKNSCLLGAGVALAVAFGCAPANAQLLMMPSGPGAWYFGGEGGWTQLNDQTDHITIADHGAASSNEGFNSGYNVGGRFGYQWGPWRFEEEYSFRHDDESSFVTHATGTRDAHAVMSNL